MNDSYSKWSDVRAKGRAVDPRPPAEQAAGKAIARERQEAYIRGQQLAEMRQAAEITQADLAASLGVSQARVSKIGENSGIDIVLTSTHLVVKRTSGRASCPMPPPPAADSDDHRLP
jgi:hypothetical protein